MANNRSVGLGRKERREVKKHHQNTTHTYRSSGLSYNTGDNTLKKHSGVDKGTLQSEHKENRGRKSKDAPRGNTKFKTKKEKTKRRTKKGRK